MTKLEKQCKEVREKISRKKKGILAVNIDERVDERGLTKDERYVLSLTKKGW